MTLRASLAVFAAAASASAADVDFNRDVRPILAEHCFACHGPDEKTRKADLRLDTEDGLKAFVTPGKPATSELMQRATSADPAEVMPPPKFGKPLSAAQTKTLTAWVEQGAKWSAHWAFVPPPPAGKATLDAILLERMKPAGLTPNGPAERHVWLRRATLDLTGLPPTPPEVDAFLADTSAAAFEKVADRLLGSPRYGEHMARFWLDAARYGDTHGLHLDNYREMWPYRDWVVRAFNANKPFDKFLVEQLAGDLLPNATLDQQIATGFLRCHVTTSEGGSIEEEVFVRNVVDRVDTFGTVLFGLTVGCARCHDHKYDPISAKDYYSLFAFFNGLEGSPLDGNAALHPPVVKVPTAEQAAKRAALEAEVAAFDRRTAAAAAVAGTAARQAARAAAAGPLRLLDGQIPATLVYKEGKPREAFVLHRGEYEQRREKVDRRTPASLPPMPASLPRDRLGLATWLVGKDHPLTARVTVNRFWQQFFGTGLVKTADDFGTQGEPPSHPELLDFLAADFRDTGWDVKRFCRAVVLSDAYRRSAKATPAALAADPQNRLLARGPRYRLDAETVRDQALFVSGLLVEKLGGPGVKPPQPAGLWEAVGYVASNTANFKADAGADKVYRRSVYTFWKRTAPPPQMAVLDAPSREACSVRRERTNTPLQALLLMNEQQAVEASRGIAARVEKEGGKTDAERLAYLFKLVVARPPTDAETKVLAALHADQLAAFTKNPAAAKALAGTPAAAALTMAANLLLNLDEVLTK